MMAFLHGDKKERLETISLAPEGILKRNKNNKELDLLINNTNIYSSDGGNN